ncbi:type II toxin-antitoxin system prevent-host-death family antitoxin [Streptomyces sp. NPDC049881]|uniref:type II toxin-antitoxin system Phd/YefM family antitoxin n=1 Tax=Streptomyces sp. NPDC049881 TaxID=3155778 RepID=UPI00341FB524
MRDDIASVRAVRARFADHVARAERGIPTVVTRGGVPVAALVPIADFDAAEEAADLLLSREAEAELAAGEPTVSMAELVAGLFPERTGGAPA